MLSYRLIAVLLCAHLTVAVPAHRDQQKAAEWTNCPLPQHKGLKCLDFEVPLDYNRPKGEKLTLTALKLPATGANKIGPAVFQWGGPGEVTSNSLVTDVNGTTDTFTVARENFDVVAVDPRGVGMNHPVKCDPAFGRKPMNDATYPKTEAEFNDALALMKDLGQSCLKRTGKLLYHLDTATHARDLDAARAAMGEEKLTYCMHPSSNHR
jgi:pimeloyl-ACP methyl ester carboxylesterase